MTEKEETEKTRRMEVAARVRHLRGLDSLAWHSNKNGSQNLGH